MSPRTISLGLVIEDDISSPCAISYAVGLCDLKRAHLSCQIAAPILHLPTGHMVPLVQALVDQVNADRLSKANLARDKVEASCSVGAVPFSCQIIQKPFSDIRNVLATAARASDLVILPQPNGLLSSVQGIVESILFGSGRPTICVPTHWHQEPAFKRIVVAWDGGARAARAVGDAMAMLDQAEEIEIVSVISDNSNRIDGAELAEHLSRHSSNLKLTDLPLAYGDAGRTLCDHLDLVKPDLLVMGAYGHSRLLQFIVGGVTSLMLSEAKIPVLYSF